MRSLFLALLCAAPLAVGYSAGEVPAAEPVVQVETVYLTSMGCDLQHCADPTHYHSCLPGCDEAGHYHDCPIGCQELAHGHGSCYVEEYDGGEVFHPCMGCIDPNCTDPSHYHYCAADCADPAHYHNCLAGCQGPGCGHESYCVYVEESSEEPIFHPCMGCGDPNCTDPDHYHYCAAGCADPTHYHNCPLGCQNYAHPHSGMGHCRGRGHHRGRHHC